MAPQKPETFMLSTEAQQALPQDAQVALQQVDNLKYFLISAPVDWPPEHYIRRFLLPTGEYVSCVLWNGLFHISGTDIIRCLSFRFQAFGRPVKNSKKFEEGVFSDLRNLKSGTDASLEEPKSPFLDFLYKNNCIRTQKKQKVFYWYSVPHDRLFLDALERDLKREKMSQEATTVAVSEPALSFQYDSSQSLYDQLTKAQQANSSSISAQHMSFPSSQTASPIIRDMDSMPPPQMPQMLQMSQVPQMPQMSQVSQIPQMPQMSQISQISQMHQVPQMPQMPQMIPQTMPPLAVGMDAIVPYTTAAAMQIPPSLAQQVVKREADFARVQYSQNGVLVDAGHQRHASMPAYALEYSPAPSFVSSQYEDYGNRSISFEPLTPPQHSTGITSEPAYVANEEAGLYTAIPDHHNGLNGFSGIAQPYNTGGTQLLRNYGNNNAYSPVIEGSPTYKQRRRRSSIVPGMPAMPAATGTAGATVHRPSDLRRSVSVCGGPVVETDESLDSSPPGLTYSNSAVSFTSQQHRELFDLSRHGTPLSTVEGSPGLKPMALQHHQEYSQMQVSDELAMANNGVSFGEQARRPIRNGGAHVIRRARSATFMDLGPYPPKTHLCPIPSCGRLFKRLEHLKRHKRTHERGDRGDATSPNPGEDEEEYSSEDQLGSAEEATSSTEGRYVASPADSAIKSGLTPTSAPQAANDFGSLQASKIPMAVSHSQAINSGSMM
ncbi:Transcription factor mst12 [Sporothrix epigloea]|uniref:Transcription factor mst12 n=1 Tax=Sporothrix epigloea TaxID=1892477 RepID=A0ABP0D9H4_9PEZI